MHWCLSIQSQQLWFSIPTSFSDRHRQQIRRVRLSHIICLTTGITQFQRSVFRTVVARWEARGLRCRKDGWERDPNNTLMKSYSYTQEKKKKVKQFQEISEESKTCHSFVTSRWTMISDPRVVVRVVGFWGGPKFEANVRRLNPSATGPRDNS